MNNLQAFFTKYCSGILFIILEVFSATLFFRFNNYQGSVYITTANAVIGKAHEWESKVSAFFSMSKNNELLTARNLYLEQQVAELSKQIISQTKDSTQVEKAILDARKAYEVISAKVITNEIDKKDNYLTLDKGTVDGVRRDMGVVCGNGVVGVVYMVSSHYCIVMPLLHSQTSLSVAIENRGYFGDLHWKGGRSDLADVNNIPRHAKFKRGDGIVTSGYSSIFPPGLPVGKILYAFNSEDGLSYRLLVHLDTDFGHLRDVCIIDNKPMQERIELMHAAKDSIKTRSN